MPTVADLLTDYAAALVDSPVPPNGREASQEYKDYFNQFVRPLEDELEAALRHHGPVLWRRSVWRAGMCPRTYRVNHFHVRRAEDCPWPPPPEQTPAEEFGFVSGQHH